MSKIKSYKGKAIYLILTCQKMSIQPLKNIKIHTILLLGWFLGTCKITFQRDNKFSQAQVIIILHFKTNKNSKNTFKLKSLKFVLK